MRSISAMLGVAIVAAMISVPDARAQDAAGLMTFQVVRSADPKCEPVCPEWIYASGKIRAKTVGEFRRFLKRLPNKDLPVVFNSVGGDVDTSLAIGREIRRRKIITGIGLAKLQCEASQCDRKAAYLIGRLSNEPADCNSACLYAFSGGVSRRSDAGNYVIADSEVRLVNVSKARAKRFRAELMARKKSYLSEMGVDAKLSLMGTSADGYDIPPKEQQSLNLVTEFKIKNYLNPDICLADERPAHCIERK